MGAYQDGYRHFTGTVDTYVENVVGIGFIFKPCTAVGDDLAGVQIFAGLVDGFGIVDSGGTDQLADNDTLSTIHNKGAGIGHDGEVTHKDLTFLHLLGLFVR